MKLRVLCASASVSLFSSADDILNSFAASRADTATAALFFLLLLGGGVGSIVTLLPPSGWEITGTSGSSRGVDVDDDGFGT